jgi:polyhydroxybutyrate depolymerase
MSNLSCWSWRARNALTVAATLWLAIGVIACQRGSGQPSSSPTASALASESPTPSLPEPHRTDVEATVDGIIRRYRLLTPPSTGTQPLPLLVLLHAGGGNADKISQQTGLDALAAEGKGIVLVPQASDRFWHAGLCCPPATTDQVDDVGYLKGVIGKVMAANAVDRSRVFAVGWSSGGEMSYRLACELSDVITGVGVVSGSLITECSPAHPVSVIDIHGTADNVEPYQGGQGYGDFTYPSVDDTLVRWTRIDGCTRHIATTTAGAVTTRLIDGCRNGAGLTFVKVQDGRHTWFSAPDASRLVWEFLSTHPRT